MAAKHYDVRTFNCSSSIGYLLKLSHLLVRDWANEAFAAHDLSFIQWIALWKLKEGTAETAADLCRTMHYDNGSVTRLLDQLEERGFLSRERSRTDRRVITLRLTPAGDKKLVELIPFAVDSLNSALSDFTRPEFAQLVQLLNKLIDSLRARGHAKDGKAAA